ncbi:MAG: hypothetical protein Q8O67_29350 [Deltaproteobacteria bacterium]|nr:hypothetical protein [Deltaproteobacteria bacterium]
MRLLPLKNLVPMLVSGLVFQICASGRFSFAVAAWLSLVSLAVLARAASWPLFLGTAFAVVLLGRTIGWHGVLTEGGVAVDGGGVVVAAAVSACLIVACLCAHRIAMRELPVLGPLALPAAVVVVEWSAVHFGWPGAALLPLSTSQPGDVPLWRFVDVLTPLGISFAVASAQSVLAGFGEAYLAPDPWPQKVRERGQRIAANLCFWFVFLGAHLGGFLRPADPVAGGHVDVVFGVCAGILVVVLALSLVTRVRRGS